MPWRKRAARKPRRRDPCTAKVSQLYPAIKCEWSGWERLQYSARKTNQTECRQIGRARPWCQSTKSRRWSAQCRRHYCPAGPHRTATDAQTSHCWRQRLGGPGAGPREKPGRPQIVSVLCAQVHDNNGQIMRKAKEGLQKSEDRNPKPEVKVQLRPRPRSPPCPRNDVSVYFPALKKSLITSATR